MYFKCDYCGKTCVDEVDDKFDLESCFNEDFDNMSEYKEITKEEFLKEVE